jgi:hypothetical protein
LLFQLSTKRNKDLVEIAPIEQPAPERRGVDQIILIVRSHGPDAFRWSTADEIGRLFGGPRLDRSQDGQVNTTIFPPALFSSMQRCASTISSSRKVLPICTDNLPSAICLTSSWSGISMKSSAPPS